LAGSTPEIDDEEENAKIGGSFSKLINSLVYSNESFFTIIPLFLRLSPRIIRATQGEKFRKFAMEEGKFIEKSDGYELYEVSSVDEFFKNVREVLAVAAGLSSLPNMFLMGLVSSYDAFISNLLTKIFTTYPKILSSSDKSISLADLTKIGSVEAAREQIIAREVDRLMRDSHAEQVVWIEKNLKCSIREGNLAGPGYI
jgi:hypothetical protein